MGDIYGLLKKEYLDNMRELLGDEYEAFISSYKEQPAHGLRISRLKCDRYGMEVSDVYEALREPFGLTGVDWCDTGFYYEPQSRPGKHALHEVGLYYIQEPSAMITGELAADIIGELIDKKGYVRVLDLCAAPGGKTTRIAEATEGRGILISNEPVPSRAKILSSNVERMGISDCLVCSQMPDELAGMFPGFFDVIVTDVPCSGEGMFRKDTEAIEQWSQDNVRNCVVRDRDILEAAHVMLRPGGYIIYSTCTFERAENEDMTEGFVSEHQGYRIEKMHRLMPHKCRGEGHFAAVLSLTGGDMHDEGAGRDRDRGRNRAEKLDYDKGVGKEARDHLTALLKETLTDKGLDALKGKVFAYGSNLYLAACEIADIAVNKRRLKVERAGLHLGEVKKGRFEPSHALALYLTPDMCVRTVDVKADDEQIRRYIAGESLTCDAALGGYALVTAGGYSAGWGKAVKGVLKNHYPKGLRRMI